MVDGTDAEALNRLREEFGQVVGAYNAAIRTGKIRAIRPAAVTAHQAIFALSQAVRALQPEQADLLAKVEAALMDVRWGRAIAETSR